MRLGTREQFKYLECSNCGCLQILDPPTDLSKYYPSTYGPFEGHRNAAPDSLLMRWARRKRAEYALSGKCLFGRLIALAKPIPWFYDQLRRCGEHLNSRILDLGCGGGSLLTSLYRDGFRCLLGVDAFVPQENIQGIGGFRILKGTVDDLAGEEPFDLIMMHHSLEHMPDHLHVLQSVHALLKPQAFLWIRTPVIGYGWRQYGVNWLRVEPPLHLFLHSIKSMRILCDQSGFKIEHISYDSTEHLFLGSEQYARDIAICDPNSWWVDPKRSIFTAEQVEAFKAKTRELNERGDGDQASFCLRRT
jgi:SAM-dependent methyltransferase